VILHKLRRAMVNPKRTPLTGAVEVDECFVGGLDRELRGGRQHGTKALVVVAVQVRAAGSGRVRMQVVQDASTATLTGFVREVVEAGALVQTDGWNSYRRLSKLGYDHRPRTQRPGRVAAHDLDQVYLDEYVLRCNRRRTPIALPQPARTRRPAAPNDVPPGLRRRAPRTAPPCSTLNPRRHRASGAKRISMTSVRQSCVSASSYPRTWTSTASSNLCPLDRFGSSDDFAESGVGDVPVSPSDVAADHAGLGGVVWVVGAV